MVARDNDAVLVPEGYHPVASAHGYTYLLPEFPRGQRPIAGQQRRPGPRLDQRNWKTKDPRVPMVTMEMEKG